MKKVYYVRHGESEANVAGIVAGSGNETPLTSNGREQAKRAGRDLKDKKIDLIVCSPMLRTVDTAKLIAGELGYDPEKIVTNILLTERQMGRFEQRPHSEYVRAMKSGEEFEGMESAQEMLARAQKAIDWIQKQKAHNIVLVSHGGTGRAIKSVVENIHHEDMYKMEGFKNTEIYEFEL